MQVNVHLLYFPTLGMNNQPHTSHIGLRLIHRSLEDIANVSVDGLTVGNGTANHQLSEWCQEDGFHIYGVSVTSQVYLDAARFARQFSGYNDPNILIVPGGAHFLRYHRTNVEAAFGDGFHAVNIGHGQSFVELVRGISEGTINVEINDGKALFHGDMPNGLRHLDESGLIIGSGSGQLPYREGDFPIAMDGNSRDANIFFGTGCRNACETCSEGIPVDFPYTTDDLEGTRSIGSLIIADGNVLKNWEQVEPYLDVVKDKYDRAVAFLDLSLLTEKNKQNIYSKIRRYKIKHLYVGIDEVSKNQLGMRRDGVLLRDDQIVTNLERLENLQDDLRETGIHGVGITANTILSPFEDRSGFEEKFGVIERLKAQGIEAQYTTLTPFPSTPLATKYEGQYVPPNLIQPTNGWQNCWSTDLPGSNTLDYISFFPNTFTSPRACSRSYTGSEFWTSFFRRLSLDLGFDDFGDGSNLKEYVKQEYDGSNYADLEIDTPNELIDAIVDERLTDNSIASKTRIAEIIFGSSYAHKIEFNLEERDNYLAVHDE